MDQGLANPASNENIGTSKTLTIFTSNQQTSTESGTGAPGQRPRGVGNVMEAANIQSRNRVRLSSGAHMGWVDCRDFPIMLPTRKTAHQHRCYLHWPGMARDFTRSRA